jgi:nucleotide-binding universal stress UspA family protein
MTTQVRDIILVPTDFSDVAGYAIDHATEIAKIFQHKICLLHVIPKKLRETPREKQIQEKLKHMAGFLSEKSGLEVSYLVEEGSIFSSISEVADRIHAEFIVMGIHGKKGVQHIVGSYAYKVVCSANVPVLVVKHMHHHVGYANIVLPLDFSRETTQKLHQAVRFARYFNATVRVFGFLSSRNRARIIKKEALLKTVKDFFNTRDVPVTTKLLVDPGMDWPEALMQYSDDVVADLVMIVAEKGSSLSEVFSQNITERIIDKMDAPVLTICRELDLEGEGKPRESLFKPFIDPLGLLKKRYR